MSAFHDLLSSRSVVLADGAMGTMLFAVGLEPGTSPERWNVEEPDKVKAVHRGYAEAGASLVLTNTFGGTHLRLERHGLAGRLAELNRAAATLAREAVTGTGHVVLVGGSIGPTGEMMAPLGVLNPELARQAFGEQAAALQEGGVDFFQIETFSDLAEIEAAIQGVRSVSALPIVATMSFDTRRRTMMGVRPEEAARRLQALGVDAIGSNCGAGIEDTLATVAEMHRAAPGLILVAKSNAGLPHTGEGGALVYDGTPARMADYALKAREAGARVIGACCGSTPAHLKAMAEALKS